MPVPRRVRLLPLLLATISVQACAFSGGKDPAAREISQVSRSKPIEAPPAGAFAVARRPGTAVPLHPTRIEPEPVAAIPPVPETALAPTPEAPPRELPGTFIPPSEAPLVAILRAYVEGRPEAAMPWIEKLEKPNREMVLQLVPAFVKASQLDPAQADPKELAVVADQFAAVAGTLARRAPLTIDKAVFCKSAESFGHYDPLPDQQTFSPRAVYMLYVEIGNLLCEPSRQIGSEGYVSRLHWSMQLRDSNDKPLELTNKAGKQTLELAGSKLNFSRSPLRDQFYQFIIEAPWKPGGYTLRIKVQDANTGREVVRALPFRVP